MTEAIDSHWRQIKPTTIDEPHIIFGSTGIVGLMMPISSLDKITEKSVRPIHPVDSGMESSSRHQFFCLLFKRYSVENLMEIIRMYGNQKMKAIKQRLKDVSLKNASALFVLCSSYSAHNMTDLMVRLLEDDKSGNDQNKMNGEYNSLQILCTHYRGDHFADIVDLLIKHKIDLNATTKTKKDNALHFLCTFYCGHKLKPLMEHLIKRGIDPAARKNSDTINDEGMTAFHLVCLYYRGDDMKQVMELLISKENATNPIALSILCESYSGDDLQELLQLIIDHVQRVYETEGTGCNALHHLCAHYKGQHLKDLVQFLLTNGIKVDALLECLTALQLLCFHYNGAYLKDVIESFRKNGADMDLAVPGIGGPLFIILLQNYRHSNLREIAVDLFYENNGVRHYCPGTLAGLCFFYRGPSGLMFDIVKRIVEGAPAADLYYPSELMEDIRFAYDMLTLFNQDLWDEDEDRHRVKKYLEDVINRLEFFYILLAV